MLHLFYKILAGIILLLLFFVAGGGVSHNSKWRIDRVGIVGANAVSTDAMQSLAEEKLLGNYFFVYARDNSYLFPRQEIEQALLDTFPRLKTVSVGRTDAHILTIVVSERKPYALWCGETRKYADLTLNDAERTLGNADGRGVNTDCWFIDDTGFVFDRATTFSEGVYLEMYGTLIGEKEGDPLHGVIHALRFATVNTLAKLIRAEFGGLVRIEMKADGENEIVIRSSAIHPFLAGVSVRFKDEQSSAVLMKNLLAAIPVQFPDNIALKKKLLYIDMRFGNKIFFGFE